MYFLFIKPNAFHWLIDQIFRGTVKRGKGNSENSIYISPLKWIDKKSFSFVLIYIYIYIYILINTERELLSFMRPDLDQLITLSLIICTMHYSFMHFEWYTQTYNVGNLESELRGSEFEFSRGPSCQWVWVGGVWTGRDLNWGWGLNRKGPEMGGVWVWSVWIVRGLSWGCSESPRSLICPGVWILRVWIGRGLNYEGLNQKGLELGVVWIGRGLKLIIRGLNAGVWIGRGLTSEGLNQEGSELGAVRIGRGLSWEGLS